VRRFRFRPSWLARGPRLPASESGGDAASDAPCVTVVIRAYVQLPPTDALALLDGVDNTGLMCWQGSTRLCQHLVDNFSRWALAAADAGSGDAPPPPLPGAPSAAAPAVEAPAPSLLPARFALIREKLDDRAARDVRNVDTVVELGCGSGVLGIVAAAVFECASVVLTDGNPECAELAADNWRASAATLQASVGATPLRAPCQGAGVALRWGALTDADAARVLFQRRASLDTLTSASSIVLVGGDVVYDVDAVAPFVDTVHALATHFLDVRRAMCPVDASSGATEGGAHFFLCFYPRAWFVGTNVILLDNVRDRLCARGWRVLLQCGTGDGDGTLLHFAL
jgi:hypothetical protein